jgi:multicomponent K+:H+ antiporter subunit D
MNHLPILPILLPMFAGALLLLMARSSMSLKRGLSLLATLAQLPLALMLISQADSATTVYALGNWAPPFGIVLVVDRLAALMLGVTAVLAACVILYACRGDDGMGRNFHAIFQFQLMGITGAFLTGDLFNLFVFFEILLIASYALLLHGAGSARVRAGLHYVVLNLFGSALFLIAVGTLYGITGTLNMADMALRVAALSPADAPLAGAAGMLLLIVFGLKSAIFPLYFWLPKAYSSASAPVAALFAIMTKVGLYSILRVYTLIFGAEAGVLAHLASDWLWPVALITIALGAIGTLAAASLGGLVSYLIVVSVGTLLAGFAIGTQEAIAASLYYLIHTTWISAALFLIAGIISRLRGPRFGSRLIAGPQMEHGTLLSGLFFIAAIAVIGMPPLSGFLGKVMLLVSAGTGTQAALLYPALMGSSLVVLVAMSRAGTTLFWRYDAVPAVVEPLDWARLLAAMVLLAGSPLMVIFASPVLDYLNAAAAQLLTPADYIEQVMSTVPVVNGGRP